MNGSLETSRDEEEVGRNVQAYREAKDELDRVYPLREFVAFAGGKLTAHSKDFEEVIETLQKAGWNLRHCVVVRIGDEDLDGLDIFVLDRAGT